MRRNLLVLLIAFACFSAFAAFASVGAFASGSVGASAGSAPASSSGSAAASAGRADTTAYVRLIFIANCFTAAENSAFKYAAANLVAEYERDSSSRQVIKRIYFDNARQIVDSINKQRLVIRSVDFLSHSRDDRIGATMTRGGMQYRTSLFEDRERLVEARVLADAEGGDLHNSSRMASIEEIDFSHFSYDAVIEVHGCHAGTGVDSLPANICRRISLALYMSGKQLAVVIGHGTRANPNAKLGGFRESVLAQDYRHGLRMVYFNGRTILATRVSGAIPQAAIVAAIVQAQNAPARGLGTGVRGLGVGSRGLPRRTTAGIQ